MKKLNLAQLIILGVTLLSGCAEQPGKIGNSSGEQRARADNAQRELSSEVRK